MHRNVVPGVGGLGLLLVGCIGSVSTAAKGGSDVDLHPSVVGDGGSGDGGSERGPGGTNVNPQSDGGSSAGTSNSGGTGDSGVGLPGTGNGSAVQPPPPAPTVHDCAGLAAQGVFEDITPPEVKAGASAAQDGGGTFAIAVDPVNQGTLYVGTRFQKVWKTTDCGATWQHVATGRNGSVVDSGMNWTFAVDPQEPNVVYTNSGYGNGLSGLFKSVNGGVDWDPVWPPAAQPELAKAFEYNFANVVAIDPANHRHLLLTFHESCKAPHPDTCIAESADAGATWRLVDGQPGWDGNEGQVISFLGNSQSWLWGSQSNGFWRSGDSGSSWQQIAGMNTTHLQGSQLARTTDGTFFQAAADGIWRSPDGAASTWKLVPNTGDVLGGLVATGDSLYASTCYFQDVCTPQYLRSDEADGSKWTAMKNVPKLGQGGTMGYDPGHHLLYSSNLLDGLWRVVAP